MKIYLKKKSQNETNQIIFTLKTEKSFKVLSNAFEKEAKNLSKFPGFSSDFKKILNISNPDGSSLITAGLGTKEELNTEKLREAFALAIGKAKSLKLSKIFISLEGLEKYFDEERLTEALVFAAFAMNSKLTKFKTSKNKTSAIEVCFTTSGTPSKKLKVGLESGTAQGKALLLCREWGDTPGNFMTPTLFAKSVQSEAKKRPGLECQVWNKARITKEKMGGLLGVSKGSDEEPRFIVLKYMGGSEKKKPLCLVGKGLTFDAGGISLKPASGMDEMRYDMCGGAAVAASMMAIADAKLKTNVIALIPSSENLMNGSANKPGDILTFRNKKTAEVLNTDAEGRLILADALSYASELKPAAIFDAATLTGAMVVALGNVHTGFYTRDDKLATQIQSVEQDAGERLWRMPLTDYHVSDIKGRFADLANMGSSRGAGSAQAAGFLEQFVDSRIPWAHFDIAGTAWNTGNRQSYCPTKGASGVLVRSFFELAKLF